MIRLLKTLLIAALSLALTAPALAQQVSGPSLSLPIVGDGRTVTVSTPLLNLTQTWNDAGVTFTGANLNFVSTASGANSAVLGLQVNGSNIWVLRKDGFQFFNSAAAFSWSGRGVLSVPANGLYRFQNAAQSAGTDLTITNSVAAFSTPVKTSALTVATLPAAATVGAGTRAFVTDANATTFASIVAGGGANGVPVYSDGTDWRIG